MSLRNSLIVYRKELRDMLRDKRTIRSMVIIPVIAFPLLILGMAYMQAHFMGTAQKEVAPIMLQGGQDSPKLLAALRDFSGVQVVPYQADAKEEVSDKKIRAMVTIPKGFDAAVSIGHPEQVSIGYYEADEKSELAKEKLQKFFDDYRNNVIRAALAARGLPPNLAEPFTVQSANIVAPSKVGAAMFGGLIPYLIIIFCFTGAMYPAMDLTAGEKERGTMETILSSPVSRTDLVIGKFLMILTASVVTALLSLISLGASFASFKNQIMSATGDSVPIAINPSAVAAVFALILPLAVLFASSLLAVALLAKSYREAQTYVSPLIFIVIAPAFAGIMPGVELNWKTGLVPILNTCLASKEIISGTYNWGHMALIFGMTCVYAAIGLAAAVRMFNREDVLFRT